MLSVGSYAEALSSIFFFVYGSVDILILIESLNSYPESMAFLVRFRRKSKYTSSVLLQKNQS
jgi:hypothetical protein